MNKIIEIKINILLLFIQTKKKLLFFKVNVNDRSLAIEIVIRKYNVSKRCSLQHKRYAY